MTSPKVIRERLAAERAERARQEEIQMLSEQQALEAELDGVEPAKKAAESRRLQAELDAAQAAGLKINKIPFGKSALWNPDGSPTDLAKKSYRRRFLKTPRYVKKEVK